MRRAAPFCETRFTMIDAAVRAPEVQSSRLAPWASVLLVAAVAATLLPLWIVSDRQGWTTGSDGTKYVQAAENFRAGRGLVHTPHGPEPYDARLVPLQLWPPGYPVLIAAASVVTPLPIAATALWLARVALLVAAPLLLACLRSLGVGRAAVPLAWLALTTQGALATTIEVRSDPAFLALVLGSLAAMFTPGGALRSAPWMALCGLLAGASVTVRNAGVALAAAQGAALALECWLHFRERPGRWPWLLAWGLGFVVPVAPQVVRSLVVFGFTQPYTMAPSTIGFVDNVRWLAYAVFSEATAARLLALELAWNAKLAAGMLVIVAAVLVYAFRGVRPARWSEQWSTARFVAVAYFALGSGLLVYGRSRYEWGDLITERYAMQIAWIALAAAALLGQRLWGVGRTGRSIVTAAAVALALSHALWFAEELQAQPPSMANRIAHDAALGERIRGARSSAMVMSNDGPLLAMLSGVDVRKIYPVEIGAERSPFADVLASHAHALEGKSDLCFVFLAEPKDDVRRRIEGDLPPGFRIVRRDDLYVATCNGDASRRYFGS